MRYYKVKPQYDNEPKFEERNDHRLHNVGILVGGELYTQNERAKLMNGAWMFEEVEVPKSQVYFCFGARFSDLTGGYDSGEKEAEIKRGEQMQAKLCFYED